MDQNPLFPQSDQPPVRPRGADQAAAIIRTKLSHLYQAEPSAKTELKEATVVRPRSKHQQYMYDLSTSGKGLAEIQTAWHQYYTNLPDAEKHAVWQEFYDSQPQLANRPQPPAAPVQQPTGPVASGPQIVTGNFAPATVPDVRPTATIRQTIRHHVTRQARRVNKTHLHSVLFGLGTGFIVLLIFLFGFFNEFVIAPFIQPGRTVSSTPIIIDPASVTVSSTPEIIIPKINVEIPLDYSQTSINEAAIEGALDNGVVHYPTTVMPGQQGNAAFFGHSSNNIFNQGKYKFAFLLLSRLQNDDTFYITYGGKLYVYKVIDKKIVKPSDISVLGSVAGQTATATLITCDPPGTTINRLVVIGQQITPDPTTNSQVTTTPALQTTTTLPGNGPTLWGRFWNWLTSSN